MSTTLYLPGDANALALGADQVAEAIVNQARQLGIEIRLVRNGSRGLFWLEPLLEVETPKGRIAYGPVDVADVPGLFKAGLVECGDHPRCLGPTEAIPYLARQKRVSMSRVGVVDPRSLEDYLAHGGGEGLMRARSMAADEIVKEVTDSGLRGRGSAAFPTGIKWNTVLNTAADQKYIVCNADEGDSGTFADRLLMEGDPFALFEGMAIAGLAVGASQGYIYVRSEYPHAAAILEHALSRASDWLDGFHIELRKAAGSYVCGEETALLESIEGRRGIVRNKPPLPAIDGLFGKPTVINNVISLISVPDILAKGAAFYHAYGVGRSRGTLPFQLAGNLKYGGLVEVPFGLTLRELLYEFGGGSDSGRPLRAVQVGGPLGAYMPESQFDTPLCYEAFTDVGAVLGHGGIVAFDDTVDMVGQAHYAMKFCAEESCGKCTPCRIGSTRGMEVIEQIRDGDVTQIELLRSLCDTMLDGSMCAMGGMTPYPVLSALNHFAEDFQ
ncbi:MAG: NADH-ubiquinone oxidoreductase-F iron-sulfur binding region domain-containing protein [Candidatus Thiodiazotropha sp. 6PLUC4]